MTIILTTWPQENYECPYCNTLMTGENVVDLHFQGLMQLIAGAPALDVVDVTYVCPGCRIKQHIRFQQNQYGGQ